VLLQSFKDEFDICDKKWSTATALVSELEKVKEEEKIFQHNYRLICDQELVR
jgi:hypothetical protein